MPTVHREGGLRFTIFTDDHPPAHIHVRGQGSAKIAIFPTVEVVWNRGLSVTDIKSALLIVRREQAKLLEAWRRYHG